jgi:hypothetical protein
MTSRTSKISMSRTLSSKRDSKASDSWPYWSYVLSPSSSHIGLHALILLPKHYTFKIWVYTWLVMLSHAVLSVIQVFHPLWCWVGLCLCESVVVLHLSKCEMTVWASMLWFEQWLERWRWLILSWHVVLESAKDRILGVNTPGQHVPPRVRYGTACLLIKNTIGCVSYSVGWGMASYFVNRLSHMVQEGHICAGNLSTASEIVCSGNHSKAWHTPAVGLCNGM